VTGVGSMKRLKSTEDEAMPSKVVAGVAGVVGADGLMVADGVK
jgi:hypothetical protein